MWTRKVLHKIDTLIGPTASVAGNVDFAGGLHVDGRIGGDVRAKPGSDATVSVSERGVIEGAVEVTNVILEGTVKGAIHASGRVVLGPKARALGDVYYGVIEMALGAEIMGKLTPAPLGEAERAGKAVKAEVKFG